MHAAFELQQILACVWGCNVWGPNHTLMYINIIQCLLMAFNQSIQLPWIFIFACTILCLVSNLVGWIWYMIYRNMSPIALRRSQNKLLVGNGRNINVILQTFGHNIDIELLSAANKHTLYPGCSYCPSIISCLPAGLARDFLHYYNNASNAIAINCVCFISWLVLALHFSLFPGWL